MEDGTDTRAGTRDNGGSPPQASPDQPDTPSNTDAPTAEDLYRDFREIVEEEAERDDRIGAVARAIKKVATRDDVE